MALTVTHAFVSAIADDPVAQAAGEILPSHWNAALNVAGTVAQADVDGLMASLAGKAPTVHTHIISDTTGLQTALDGKQVAGSYAAAVHTHAQADVTGLVTALAGKANTSHTHAQADVTGLVADLAAKQATLVSGTSIKTVNGNSLLGSGDVVISGGGGGVIWEATTITLPDARGVFEWEQAVTNAGVSPTSVIDLKLAPALETDYLEYDPQFTEIRSMVATPSTGSFVVALTFRELHSGPINLQYTVN